MIHFQLQVSLPPCLDGVKKEGDQLINVSCVTAGTLPGLDAAHYNLITQLKPYEDLVEIP